MRDFLTMFSSRDYLNLTVNVMVGTPLEHPFFAKKEVFHQSIDGIEANTLLKYIVLFYDPKSPLQGKILDHIDRKKAAAKIAGFKDNGKNFQREAEEIMYCKNDQVNEMIIEFLRSLKIDEWSYLCASREAFYRIINDAIGEAKGGSTKSSVDIAVSRAKLDSEAEQMLNRLSERYLNFVAKDESVYLKDNIFSLIENERKIFRITPERMAEIDG